MGLHACICQVGVSFVHLSAKIFLCSVKEFMIVDFGFIHACNG
jgi:hypothetical protein